MIQEALFDAQPVAGGANLPPSNPPTVAQPLGACVKCQKEEATRRSPSGKYVYCEKCGKCGAKAVSSTALGISVKTCGRSVEEFVWHPNMQIWVCPCVPQF